MKRQRLSLYVKKLCGTTMAELLVVMVISGILFLLLFEGLSIVQRYGRMLDSKLNTKSGLLYSHQVLEMLLEGTDSIRRDENELLFYGAKGDSSVNRLLLDSTHILLLRSDHTDTLFTGLVDIELHLVREGFSLVDSLILSIRIGRDTVRLDYGLPRSRQWVLNENMKEDDTDHW